MKGKKGQGEMITTILLVLVALAAVAIVATFIVKNVQQSAATAEQKQKCLKVEFDISPIKAGDTAVTVRRMGASTDIPLTDVKVYYDGIECATTATGDIAAGTTKTITVTAGTAGTCLPAAADTFVANKKVEVAPILSDGYVCNSAAEETVTS